MKKWRRILVKLLYIGAWIASILDFAEGAITGNRLATIEGLLLLILVMVAAPLLEAWV